MEQGDESRVQDAAQSATGPTALSQPLGVTADSEPRQRKRGCEDDALPDAPDGKKGRVDVEEEADDAPKGQQSDLARARKEGANAILAAINNVIESVRRPPSSDAETRTRQLDGALLLTVRQDPTPAGTRISATAREGAVPAVGAPAAPQSASESDAQAPLAEVLILAMTGPPDRRGCCRVVQLFSVERDKERTAPGQDRQALLETLRCAVEEGWLSSEDRVSTLACATTQSELDDLVAEYGHWGFQRSTEPRRTTGGVAMASTVQALLASSTT
jgi:hypothetical protein